MHDPPEQEDPEHGSQDEMHDRAQEAALHELPEPRDEEATNRSDDVARRTLSHVAPPSVTVLERRDTAALGLLKRLETEGAVNGGTYTVGAMLVDPPATPFVHVLPAERMPPADWLGRLSTPALLVDLDVVRHNVRRVIELCGGDAARWRPHVKTTKLPEVWRELVLAGVRHFKCATTREAAVLCGVLEAEGVEGDVLLAHPLRGPGLARLGAIAASYPRQRCSVLCEDAAVLVDVPRDIGLFVDVNVGMDRTGVAIEDAATIVELARRAGPRFRGIHAYEGHLHQDDAVERAKSAQPIYAACVGLLDTLRAAGLTAGELITSGTPTFRSALAHAPLRELANTIHRVSPGTVVFHDARSESQDKDLGLLPAALVLTRVVSRPARGVVTCDAGSKSLAAEAGDPLAVVLGRPDLVPTRANEEHLCLSCDESAAPARGTPLLLVPRHVCPTVNLADEAVLQERGVCVGVRPVLARGHETLLDM